MERTLTIDGTRLVLDDEGRGDAIVCLHAIGHDARDFARLRARFAPAHRVIAIDWPGQGRSPRDGRPVTAAHYAELLEAVLDALDIETCVVVGNSIGGAAAIAFAARRAERVRGLVLENPGGLAPVDDRTAQTVLAAMARFFDAGTRGAWWFGPAFAVYYRLVLQRPAGREVRNRIVANRRALAPILAEAWRGFATPASDGRADAGRLQCPVLFAWATRDTFVSLSRSLPAIRTVPNATVERFAAGHAAHLETPDEFEAAVERFLAKLPAVETTRRPAVTSGT
jgi:4,5:9,10-diseco-3-hydroxy-5,9,17-trioxoandrosta-1(10),2-diene-4-oate hydrolase